MSLEKLEQKDLKLGEEIIELAHALTAKGLVVRTWGNFSRRVDSKSILITPSGKSYDKMRPDDLVKIDLSGGKAEIVSPGKPSSEMPMHALSYQLYPDVNVVIHTHQIFASAISLYGRSFPLTEEYAAGFGSDSLELSAYNLPGSASLHKNMKATMEKSHGKVILMERHGAFILASNMEEAIVRAELLEKFSREKFTELTGKEASWRSDIHLNSSDEEPAEHIIDAQGKEEVCVYSRDPLIQEFLNKGLSTYLDDFAQICGPTVKDRRKRNSVVFDPMQGRARCYGRDEADACNVRAVLEKNARAAHVAGISKQKPIAGWEARLMRFIYRAKYSKVAE